MSYVIAATDMLETAAANVASIGSSLNSANAAAAIPTTSLVAAAADEVSTAIGALFSPLAAAVQSAQGLRKPGHRR